MGTRLALAVSVALLVGGCSAGEDRAVAPIVTVPLPPEQATSTTAAPATAAPSKGATALTKFASCSSLLRHFKREALKLVTPYGLSEHTQAFPQAVNGVARATSGSGMATEGLAAGASTDNAATGAPPSYSGTNVQEAGVDEPDLMKSDGRRLVTVARGVLTVVDIGAAAPRISGTLPLPGDSAPTELLLSGDRAVVFGVAWEERPSSTVRIVDLADPSKPAIVATLRMEGNYVSARLAGGVVRLVVEHGLKGPRFAFPDEPVLPEDVDHLVARNKAAIQRSRVEDWLPTYTLERPGRAPLTEPLAPCAAVLRPKAFAGLGTVSVLTLDPADPAPANPACVLGGGHLVYAGPDNLYVATERWQVAAGSTELHRFAIPGAEPATYVASGEVEVTVLNQFSMSELDGRLRVATTVQTPRGGTENVVHVLEAHGGRLVSIGRLGGLGHEGETIHSVRFMGTKGYVVTFRQTDPLYVIDLHDPRHPQLRGELQVPGFSSYLHPLSDSVLLGVGRGPGSQGGQGLQLSLFDVRDPARPVRIANQVFEQAHSPAEHDHHAFLWWAPAGRLVVPVHRSDGVLRSRVLVVDVDPAKGFTAVNYLEHAGVQRSMVSGPRLLTLSDTGLMTYDLASLAQQAWLAW